MTAILSVIIPASNEAGYIGRCLRAVFESAPICGFGVEVIVVANGCHDNTAQAARNFSAMAAPRGWHLKVLELAKGDKIAALNAADQAAIGRVRVYLDADVVVAPDLLNDLAQALKGGAARYASGRVKIERPVSRISMLYARFWRNVPFMQSPAPGFGVYAVNAAGRARWAEFPDVISDDTFVRLQFTPQERVQVAASYSWPLVEGLTNLIRVRRRQDQGVQEIAARFPALMHNDAKRPAQVFDLALRDPLGFAVYGLVALVVRVTRDRAPQDWVRGR